MTPEQLELSLRSFGRRRPFLPFVIDMNSGGQFLVRHPEAVRVDGEFYVARSPGGRYEVFVAESVCRLLDAPPSGPAG